MLRNTIQTHNPQLLFPAPSVIARTYHHHHRRWRSVPLSHVTDTTWKLSKQFIFFRVYSSPLVQTLMVIGYQHPIGLSLLTDVSSLTSGWNVITSIVKFKPGYKTRSPNFTNSLVRRDVNTLRLHHHQLQHYHVVTTQTEHKFLQFLFFFFLLCLFRFFFPLFSPDRCNGLLNGPPRRQRGGRGTWTPAVPPKHTHLDSVTLTGFTWMLYSQCNEEGEGGFCDYCSSHNEETVHRVNRDLVTELGSC